jgi:hydroxymethylpyrimidine pyrophosphatase-like HAD family hydrolase
MIRMIALDMDGTLLGAEGRVSSRNLAAIQSAESAGIKVVVATGRRHSYAMRQLRELELGHENVLVSSNGTVTRMLGPGAHLLDRAFLSIETSLWLCQHLDEFRNALVITFDRVGPDGDDTRGALVVEELDELHASIDRWMTANAPYIERVSPIEQCLLALKGQEIDAPIQMMLCGPVERMRRAETRLLEHPGVSAVGITPAGSRPDAKVDLSRTEYPERDLSIVDILPAGCSKGAALLRLAKGWEIQPEEILAIGDNWNDVSMLEIAGQGVLMENAPDDLKLLAAERGWVIGGHHLADGVAEAVESLLAHNDVLPEPVGSRSR